MMTAIVADIQHASLHDGPGIRTTVFFKGCPLNCLWCHNPECIEKKPQILNYPEKCIGCSECEKGCFAGAKVVCGKEMSAEQIFDEIMLDVNYYQDNGGVTFSGGEPLLYPDVIKEVIHLCKKHNIKTAIETSLYHYDEEILKSVDCIMADFKIFDDVKHKEYTGVSNDIIKKHFLLLDKLNKPFIVRTPIIPGINDSSDEILNIKDFLNPFKNLTAYELLPYHPLGVSKQTALGIETQSFETPTKQLMEDLKHYAEL